MYKELVFEWDVRKVEENLQLHGVRFETASEAFSDPNQVVSGNYHFAGEDEQRWQLIGMTKGLLLLLVIFVDRSNAENEIMRLISA